MDPFVSLHNCALDDEDLAIRELRPVASLGGRTVVDPTCRGIGRNPEALVRISRATGLNIIMLLWCERFRIIEVIERN